jgi:holdfast attachment protein HfaA
MARIELIAKPALVLALTLSGLAAATGAQAQTMNANSGSYNAGYGRTSDQENQAVNPQMRDANGNLVIVDGVIEAGSDGSVFSNAGASGAFDTVAGVGASGGASAVGNNLVVVTEGNNNTVIVNSQQTNSGNVSANSSLNGGVSNGQ